jgi:hypothetical protein
MNRENKPVNPSELALNDDEIRQFDIPEEIEKEKVEDVSEVPITQDKKVEDELESQDRYIFYKVGKDGRKALIDYEIDKSTITALGGLENVVRKRIVPLYGYGEYIPALVKYDKKTGKKIIGVGNAINILEPIQPIQPVQQQNEYSLMLNQMKDLISQMLEREDQKRREDEARWNRIIESMKVKTPDTDNNMIAIMMQQMNNQMMMMMEMMRSKKDEVSPLQGLEKVLEPIVNKLKFLEEEINNKKAPDLDLLNLRPPKEDNEKTLLETIKAVQEIIKPNKNESDEIVNLRKELAQMQEKLAQTQIETLKKEIEELKSYAMNKESEIDRFMELYDRVMDLSKYVNPRDNDAFSSLVKSLAEHAPELISQISQNKNVSQEQLNALVEENNKLKEMLSKYQEAIKKAVEKKKLLTEGKRGRKPKVDEQSEVEQPKIEQPKKEEKPVTTQKEIHKKVVIPQNIVEMLDRSGSDDDIAKVMVEFLKLNGTQIFDTSTQRIILEKKADGIKEVFNKIIEDNKDVLKPETYEKLKKYIENTYKEWYKSFLQMAKAGI